jgi:hypothetical protein
MHNLYTVVIASIPYSRASQPIILDCLLGSLLTDITGMPNALRTFSTQMFSVSEFMKLDDLKTIALFMDIQIASVTDNAEGVLQTMP